MSSNYEKRANRFMCYSQVPLACSVIFFLFALVSLQP